jgi:hypothetical protein
VLAATEWYCKTHEKEEKKKKKKSSSSFFVRCTTNAEWVDTQIA